MLTKFTINIIVNNKILWYNNTKQNFTELIKIKKVLILSCSTGEGHNSAAHAIEDALAEKGIEFELLDPISFRSEGARRRVASLYNNMIRKTPHLFGVVYKAGGLFEKTRITSPVYYANGVYSKRLEEYIVNNGFDAVISTHLYGMEALTAIKKRGNNIPSFGIITDYTCIPFTGETRLDKYFIPSGELELEFISKGLPSESLIASGIPTAKRFSNRFSKEEAREMLGISGSTRIYLAATGGVGCENMFRCLEALKRAEKGDYCIYLLTGRNKLMKERIDKKYKKSKHIVSVPFTRDINVYMNAADVMISKAGGLSSTEAAVAGIPLVHVHAIPGCETKNVQFFSEKGMSVYAKSSAEAARLAISLATDTEKAEKMRECQRKYVNSDAAVRIVDEIISFCDR